MDASNVIIEKLLSYSGLSARQFAERIGTKTAQAIYDLQKGRTKSISSDIGNKILSCFPEVNRVWLLTGEGDMLIDSSYLLERNIHEPRVLSGMETSSPNGIPLIPQEAIAGFPDIDTLGVSFDQCPRYSIPEFQARGAQFIIRVSGNSMAPTFLNGDLLACRKIEQITFIQWGEAYVIDTMQGPLLKRVFQTDGDSDRIKCVSDNSSYPPYEIACSDVRSLSTIIGLLRLT